MGRECGLRALYDIKEELSAAKKKQIREDTPPRAIRRAARDWAPNPRVTRKTMEESFSSDLVQTFPEARRIRIVPTRERTPAEIESIESEEN